MTISQATANLTLPEARALAQRLANETQACHIISERGPAREYVVVDARKASGDDLGDAIDYAYPNYGGV